MSSPPEKGSASVFVGSGNETADSTSIAPAPPDTLLFSIDLNSLQLVSLTGDAMSILGISEQACSLHGALIRAHLHPDDRYRVEILLEDSLSLGHSFVATYRWTRPDTGRVVLLTCRAHAETGCTALSGIITDITEAATTIEHDGLASTTLTDNLALMGLQGLTLSLELVIQTISTPNDLRFASFGLGDYAESDLKIGTSLLSCFSEPESKLAVQAIFDQALSSRSGRAVLETKEFRIVSQVIPSLATPQGYLLYALPIAEEQALRQELRVLKERINELERCGNSAPMLLNMSQEIVGYTALIQKHTNESPFLFHITNSLATTVRDLSVRAREVVAGFQSQQDALQRPQPLIRSRRATDNHVLIFSSHTKRIRHLQAALLSDAGLSTRAAALEAETLKTTLHDAPDAKVLIIDVPGKEPPLSSLIRTMRRLFPDVYVVCLVPGSAQSYPELQRAGAILVIGKPITAHELVRVARGLLHLSAAMTLSDEPSFSSSDEASDSGRTG